MHEGPVFEGRGAPPKSPVEWVKHKLAVRYTEKGRIGDEVEKMAKTVGTLTPEQREEAAERLHLEGKIKNKVVRTIVGDAIVATVVVGGTGYLIARPGARAILSGTLRTGSRVSREFVSETLKAKSVNLRAANEGNPGLFRKLFASMISGVERASSGAGNRVESLLEKAESAADSVKH